MSSFFQLFLAWGVLLLVILVLYLVDKINIIYQRQGQDAPAPTYSDGLFGDLVGKALWDAMSGIPLPGFDPKLVQDLKPHYEPVLRQHIEQTFLQGVTDQREGRAGVPANNRMIPPRGAVWSLGCPCTICPACTNAAWSMAKTSRQNVCGCNKPSIKCV